MLANIALTWFFHIKISKSKKSANDCASTGPKQAFKYEPYQPIGN